MSNQLVFDIGLNNGDDSEYYLHLGYQVLGIEANPLLAAACVKRFEKEIGLGRMHVLNAGILREPGEFTFYRNLTDDAWSSFEPERGKRDGRWEELRIPCVTTAQLVERHGCPFFMKVDIEGADLQAIVTLTKDVAPAYLSAELNAHDPILETLVELDYTAFKFVAGETFRCSAPIWDHEVGWRFLRKIGRTVPLFRRAMSKLPERMRVKSEFDPPGKYAPGNYPFTFYSSGPFGELAAGRWLSPDSAIQWFNKLLEGYRRAGEAERLWWDVHARHSKAPRPE